MKLRSGFRAAVLMKNRLHHESGEPIEEPVHPGQQRRTRRGQIFSKDYLSSARVDQHTGWQYRLSTSSSSWWHETGWSWKWAHIFSRISFFCYSWFRLQLTAIHCNRRRSVNLTPSHREFSRTFANISSLFTCTAWLKVM